MAKKNKKQVTPEPELQQLDVEFSEEGIAEVNARPAEKAKKKRNK